MSASTRLLQIVTFNGIAPSATATLPHNINVDGAQKIPDFVAMDLAGFTVAVTATTVTVTNTTGAPASVNVWLELKHSIPRQLSGGVSNLNPQPFIVAVGGGGGAAPWLPINPIVNAVFGGSFSVLAGRFNLIDASQSSDGIALLPAASSVPNGTPLGIGNYPGLNGLDSVSIQPSPFAGDSINGSTTTPNSLLQIDNTLAFLLLVSDGVSNWQAISFKA